jgi:hypothetical protein
VTDEGEEILRAGDCAGFKAGIKDAHHLQNRSPDDALIHAGWLHAQRRHPLSGIELVPPECPGHRARAYGAEPRIAAQVRDAPEELSPSPHEMSAHVV